MFKSASRGIVCISFIFCALSSLAGINPITMTAVNSVITLPQGGVGSISYVVNVNSVVRPAGVPLIFSLVDLPSWATQITSGVSGCSGLPICQKAFGLRAGDSCCLMLRLYGRLLTAGQRYAITPQIATNPATFKAESTSLDVTVTSDPALATSLSNLALVALGLPRIITVSNNGLSDATDLNINYPSWPTGTSASTTCGSTLAAGASCTITITPGVAATSSCNSSLTAPTPGTVTVSASNATSVFTDVVVLKYGCIYQQGYLFAIDDTTPASTGIGGTIVSLANNSNDIQWYNGTFIDVTTDLLDGKTNTAAIIAAQGQGNYAATLCNDYTIDSNGASPCASGTYCYDLWYLPAICQLGVPDNFGFCPIGTQSMTSNLPSLINCTSSPGCFDGIYWSSSQYDSNEAYGQYVDSSPHLSYADTNELFQTRCTRDLNYE